MMRIAVLLLVLGALHAEPAFDILIRGARVVDGAGTPWYMSDVGISGDTIAAVGRLRHIEAKVAIDGTGLVIAPGFIDPHTHSPETLPGIPLSRRTQALAPSAENYIRQGVTTIVDGHDGSSALSIETFLKRIQAAGILTNVATYIGHGTIREHVMGLVNRKPSQRELEAMKGLVRRAMVDGALGLSTGLFYVPGVYADTSEVITLASVAGEFGGLHVSHIRDETNGVYDGVKETIRIGEAARIPTHVTHHKVAGARNWGRTAETLRLIDEARAKGVDVTIDVYPYTASFGPSSHLFPRWALEGGETALLSRLADPQLRFRIKKETIQILTDLRRPADVIIAKCQHDLSLIGKSLADLTMLRVGKSDLDEVAETAIQIQERGGSHNIYHLLDEADIHRLLRHSTTMIASDGGIGGAVPHPRSYGAFPRILRRYVLESKLLTFEDAIRRMTSFTATRLQLHDRGLIRPGLKADLVVFDPALIGDRATFQHPTEYAVGVRHVIVNGRFALRDGTLTNERPGQVLRRR